MRIALINPPAENQAVREGRCMQRKEVWSSLWPPTSLAYCGSLLMKDDHEVSGIDCIAEKIDMNELLSRLSKYCPDIVLINTSTPTIDEDLSSAEAIKKMLPQTNTVVFGMHPSAMPNECLAHDGVDIVITGEPEETIREIASKISHGEEIIGVKGIVFRDRTGNIATAGLREPIENLDSLPFPARDLFNLSCYTMPGKDMAPAPFLTVTPSRGCPYQCVFCNASTYYGKKTRFRTPKSVVAEIKRGVEKMGINNFLFWTESFTMDPSFAMAVSEEIIRQGVKFDWVCNSRVDAVSYELLAKMKEAGCWMISYGIESGNDKILLSTKKGITVEDSLRAVSASRKAGLKTVAHVIVGLPGETKETARATTKFLNDAGVDYAQFYCAVPFPGSELYDVASANGWISEKRWEHFNQTESVMDMPGISRDQVMRMKNKAYFNHYLNLKRIMRMIRGINMKGFIFAVKNAALLATVTIRGKK